MTACGSRLVALAGLAMACGCATGRTPGAWDPQIQARQAQTALAREDFEGAREGLVQLASQCRAGEYGRDAMLLWAAAELDPTNPSGSPRLGARLAGAYLQLPDAPEGGRVLARTLYRLAADLGGLTELPPEDDAPTAPPLANRFELCALETISQVPRPLPSLPLATTAARVAGLEADLTARADSVEALLGRDSTQRARIAELEAELQRITELLTSGATREARTLVP